MAPSTTGKVDSTLCRRDRVDILLEEYRSLNGLLLFRLNAMDRRLPVSAGFVAVTFATVLGLPPESRAAILLATPSAVLWLVRTTTQHARAKEDHLRRIDEIEVAINTIANEDLLMFQSQHPSRSRLTSGRTGSATVVATSLGGLFTLFLCVFLYCGDTGKLLELIIPNWTYASYVGLIAIDALICPIRLAKYRYAKRPHVIVKPL